MYYKNIMTPPESSEVTLQVVASPTIIVLITLEVSYLFLKGIYGTGVTHDNRHLWSSHFIVQATGLTHKWHASLKKTCPRQACFAAASVTTKKKLFLKTDTWFLTCCCCWPAHILRSSSSGPPISIEAGSAGANVIRLFFFDTDWRSERLS